MNEFEILEKYVKPISKAPVVLGKGDDCSVVEWSESQYLLQTSDVLVEDVHFRRKNISPADLGWKSLTVNVSDVASMGGRPEWAHLTLGLPTDLDENWVELFFSGFYKALEYYNFPLIGGDISRNPRSLFVDVHLSGRIEKENCRFRKGISEPGQVLCVTGSLGDSGAGLYALERSFSCHENLLRAHSRPQVSLDQALFLGKYKQVTGMTDLSDGLLSDLTQIPACAMEISLEEIPMSPEMIQFAEEHGVDPLQWALTGGEDYALLFSCKEEDLKALQASWNKKFDQSFSVVGRVVSVSPSIKTLRNGRVVELSFEPFQHFL